MKKFVIITLLVSIVMLSVIPIFASYSESISIEREIIKPQFTAIWSMSAGLSIDSSGKATCSGSVTPASSTYTADMTISLQKSTSSGWSTIKSWSGSGVGYEGVIIDAKYYVVSGKYRVRTTADIYNSSGSLLETESFYSATRTY